MKLPVLRSLFLFSFLFFFITAAAQSSAGNSKSLLWKISSNELQKPSYLFGTIHLICPEDLIWTPAMKKSLDATNLVCLEMDMDDPSIMMEIAVGMMDNSGKKLKDYFTEDQYTRISHFVKDSLGMDIAMFQQVKPTALQMLFATKTVDCPNPVAYEMMLSDEAKKQKKEVVGLEPVSEQLELFNNLPGDSVINELVTMSEGGYTKDQEKYKRLVRMYKAQDLPALYKYIEESKNEGANLDAFLDVRNEKWISRMTERMENGPVFFAVGAGHLWGDKGLITLLRKSGYTVVPVK